MRKYYFIFKTSFLDSINYVSSLFFKFISFFITMFVMFNLWSYIYNDPSKIINGYTLSQMLWYMLIAEIMVYGCGKMIRDSVIEDVKSGNIAYQINKPYHYIGYIMSKYIGDGIIRVILYTIVSCTIGLMFVGPIPGFYFINMGFIIVSFILGFIINGMIKLTISLISFWVEDATPFHWIYEKILLIFGVFFPIEMFPKIIRPIITYTPVYVVIYGPAKLVVDFSFPMFYKILLSQFVYLIIIFIIMSFVYKKGVKKVNVNGG